MNWKYRVIFSALLGTVLCQPLHGISITQVRFSWGIDKENSPVDRIATGTTELKSIPIYVSFAIIGGELDFTKMKSGGLLGVTVEFWVDGRLLRAPQVGITPGAWLRDSDGLLLELEERGFFDWRTVAFISEPLGDALEVRIRDGTGVPLAPSGHTGGIYAPRLTLTGR